VSDYDTQVKKQRALDELREKMSADAVEAEHAKATGKELTRKMHKQIDSDVRDYQPKTRVGDDDDSYDPRPWYSKPSGVVKKLNPRR
jgi:hypothetical protein